MVKKIGLWIIFLSLINIALFIIFYIYFVPREKRRFDLQKNIINQFIFLIIILGVVFFHLLEVNILDPPITNWIGTDFSENIRGFEGDTVFWFSQHWTPVLVYIFVIIYIAVYTFTLWFTPLYFIITDNKNI